MKPQIGKATKHTITPEVTVSVVKWSDTEYNCRVYYNAHTHLYPDNLGHVILEMDLESEMQVYRFIEDAKEEHAE